LDATQRSRIAAEVDMPAAAAASADEAIWWLIEVVLRSPAAAAVVPVQDLLGLGSDARMNTPGTIVDNWRWRMPPGGPTDDLAVRLGAAVAHADRARPRV
ncbi:MAG: 4-alpha-glucanotransferase, partial [Acidimicrobiia bacterium]